MINNLPYDLIENCTKQCISEMLYEDPLNLNSERKYPEASTVEVKHHEKFFEPEEDWQKNRPFIKRSENPEFIYSDHIDKVEIYVTRHFGTMTSKGKLWVIGRRPGIKGKLCWIRLKVNHTVCGEGGYRSTDYYELTLKNWR